MKKKVEEYQQIDIFQAMATVNSEDRSGHWILCDCSYEGPFKTYRSLLESKKEFKRALKMYDELDGVPHYDELNKRTAVGHWLAKHKNLQVWEDCSESFVKQEIEHRIERKRRKENYL